MAKIFANIGNARFIFREAIRTSWLIKQHDTVM